MASRPGLGIGSWTLLLAIRWADAWAPTNWADAWRCLPDPVFDAAAGEAPRFRMRDPRFSDAVIAALEAGSAQLPEGAAFHGRVARDTLVLEANNWDTSFLTTWVAAILLQERVRVLQLGHWWTSQ